MMPYRVKLLFGYLKEGKTVLETIFPVLNSLRSVLHVSFASLVTAREFLEVHLFDSEFCFLNLLRQVYIFLHIRCRSRSFKCAYHLLITVSATAVSCLEANL